MIRPTLALLLLFSAGCSAATAVSAVGSSPDRTALLLSDRPAPRPTCRILYQPAILPAVSAVVDSAALAAEIAGYAAARPLRDGSLRALYSVALDGGAITRLHPLDYWLPQGEAEAFTAMVRRHLRPSTAGALQARLLVETENGVAVRLGRSETCPPHVGTRLRLRSPALSEGQRARPVRVRMMVDERGTVNGVTVASGSGYPDVDRLAVQMLERRRIGPGLIDGVPVAMQHEETIEVQHRR
jgi:TonB family protein